MDYYLREFLIGGLLVLATIVAMNYMKPDTVAVLANIPVNAPSIRNSNIVNSKPENTNETTANYEGIPTSAKKSEKTKTNQQVEAEKNEEISSSDSRAKLKKKRFNGRVIMMNAIVRSSPSMYAPEVYVISYDEPIKIGKSAGGNNPWFRVRTESGATGWMHGNTIEFIK